MAETFSFYSNVPRQTLANGVPWTYKEGELMPWQKSSWGNTSVMEQLQYPTSSDVPQAASNNATTKPYTNGALNTGQLFSLASGALGMMSDYTNSRYQARALNAQASTYDNQRFLNYEAYRTNIRYMAEENLANASRLIDTYYAFGGEQMAAIAASGFDISSGEQRIIKDTFQKMANELYLANRSNYLKSFELWRSTELENARLLAAAQSARSQAKYVKKMGKVNLIAGALGTAANVYSLGQSGRTRDIGVKGV